MGSITNYAIFKDLDESSDVAMFGIGRRYLEKHLPQCYQRIKCLKCKKMGHTSYVCWFLSKYHTDKVEEYHKRALKEINSNNSFKNDLLKKYKQDKLQINNLHCDYKTKQHLFRKLNKKLQD